MQQIGANVATRCLSDALERGGDAHWVHM